MPDLAAQIHPDLNPHIDAAQLTLGSNRKVTWLCHCQECGTPHVWRAPVARRALRGRGCPICARKQPCRCNSLASVHPETAQQWHPQLNAGRQPSDVLPGSGFKAWWTCPAHGPYRASVVNRTTRGSGCPTCGHAASVSGWHRRPTLAEERPELAAQWHPARNGGLRPDGVTGGSHRKAWWLCPEACPVCGASHEWETKVNVRTSHAIRQGNGCPFCAGQLVCPQGCNSLAALHPRLAREWHQTLNATVPQQHLQYSNDCVFWQHSAPDGTTHEWSARISDRTYHKSDCPKCAHTSRRLNRLKLKDG